MPAMEPHSNVYKCRTLSMIFLIVIATLLIALRLGISIFAYHRLDHSKHYDYRRAQLLKNALAEQFGYEVELSPCEQKANNYLMELKWLEYEKWDLNDSSSLYGKDFYQIRKKLEESKMYKLLRKMPKGAILHINDIGMVDIDYLIKLTYYPNLWICVSSFDEYMKLQFSKTLNQTNASSSDCNWFLLKKYRILHGAANVDAKLKDSFSIKEDSEAEIATKIPQKRIKQLIYGLITYMPVWKMYWQKALEQVVEDGIQYVEIRTEVDNLYNLNGVNISHLNAIQVLKEISEKFSARNGSFIGSKIIYTPSRNIPNDEIFKRLDYALILKLVFQDYIAGIDLVADAPHSRPLKAFIKPLLNYEDQIDYYLTLSEQQWSDWHCEENLLDAYLLGSKRLVISYPLIQQAFLIRQFQKSNAALILNPISHQLLKTPGYTYYHPGALLFAFNLNLVISSDYPALWGAQPLSHDFFLTFMKIAPRNADLKVLKQLVINSIMYSAMSDVQKNNALELLLVLWNNWIYDINSNIK